MRTRFLNRLAAFSAISLALPFTTHAHEVYVLDPETVARSMAVQSPNPFMAYFGNEYVFFFWAFVSVVTVSTMLCASIFHLFEKRLDPLLFHLKRFAHPIARITLGISILSFGIAGRLFGTELDFQTLFGALTLPMQICFVVGGAAVILGLYTRAVALFFIAIYAYAATLFGFYVLTYTDYLGAALLLLILGSGAWSIDAHIPGMRRISDALAHLRPYAFPLMRICFGFAIIYASIYAKFLHSQLALEVVNQYHLTAYFPFDPLFVVLGALIIEFLAGLMMLLGIEIRWTGLFLIFWLTLSLLYFQEAVWPHVILFGVGFSLFCHGYDRFSLEGYFLKRRSTEPIF